MAAIYEYSWSCRRIAERPSRVIRGPGDVHEMCRDMTSLDHEELRVLGLSARNGVEAVETVYRGNVSAAVVRIGELFRTPIRLNSASIIVAHNHPSGDPTPSPDDLHLTAEAIAAGRLLDIPVRDHVVVADEGYTSLRDRGITFER
jgi:DNA repair protein RadC